MAFICGIYSVDVIDFANMAVFVFSLLLVNFGIWLIFKRKRSSWNLIVLTFLIGAAASAYSLSYEKSGLYPLDGNFVEISGYVYEIPEEKDGRYTYIIKTDGASYKGKVYNVRELVRLNTDMKLEYAQNVGIRGFLDRINEKMNHSDFDYSRYYKSSGIFYKISDFEIAADNSKRKLYTLKNLSYMYKNKASELIDSKLGGDEAALLKAVITGQKNDFSEEYEDILRKTNTMRMLYPAYLHIILILMIANAVVSVFGRKAKDWVSVILVLIYAVLCSSSIAGVKTALTIAAAIIAVRKFGYMHYPDILSFVFVMILAVNPLLAFHSGFVLSVFVSWLFFMLRETVYGMLGFIRSAGVKKILSMYIISTIGMIPLCAYYFNGISVYGGLFNIVYFPLVMLCVCFFPLLYIEIMIFSRAYLGGCIITFAVYCMHKLPYLIDALPCSHINLARPSSIWIVMLFAAVILIRDLYCRKRDSIRVMAAGGILAGGIVSAIIVFVMSLGSMEIMFVNVGQGDGALIKLPNGGNIIIDGGGGEEFSDYDAGEKLFLPYLKNEGAYRIDLAVLSHYHKDHCLGTIAAMEKLNVQAVMMPDLMDGNEYREEIERIAAEKNIEIIYPADGDRILFGDEAVIDVISAGNEHSENDTSIVFNLKCNGVTATFTGDTTKYTEKKYLDRFEDTDILKAAHHGSATSNSQEFIDVVKPEFTVISVGEDNQYLLPNDEVVERYENFGTEILRTDELGDIRFSISKSGKISYSSYYQKQ